MRLAGQAQIGGYDVGNGSHGALQAQAGFDYGNFSFDGVLAWAKDAVSLSTFNGGSLGQCRLTGPYASWSIKVNSVCYDTNDVLKATLSNNFGVELMASYKWDRFKFYGGYIYAKLSNPSDAYCVRVHGRCTPRFSFRRPPSRRRPIFSQRHIEHAGLRPPQGAEDVLDRREIVGSGHWLHGWGALDLAAAFYYQTQNNFNFGWTTGKFHGIPLGSHGAACTGTGAFISSSKCAGSQDGIGFLADWRPVKRVDIYAGVMITNVYGGLANGYYSVISGRRRKEDRRYRGRAHAELRPDDRHPHSVLILASVLPEERARAQEVRAPFFLPGA